MVKIQERSGVSSPRKSGVEKGLSHFLDRFRVTLLGVWLLWVGLFLPSGKAFGSKVTVTGTDLAPTFAPEDTIPVVRLAFSSLIGNPKIVSITVQRTGSATDSDVQRVLIYEDGNQDDVIDNKATPIGAGGTFSCGSTIVSSLEEVTLSETSYWLVSYDIASGAVISNTAGCSIGSGDIAGKKGTNVSFAGVTTGDYSLPVELFLFTATLAGKAILLQWLTESEVNNLGFYIYRSLEENGPYKRITELIPGGGNTPTQQTYSFTDRNVTLGITYWYKLEEVDFDGTRTMHGPITVTLQEEGEVVLSRRPPKYALQQSYPNPFNSTTTIRYQLPEPAYVRLTISNLLGQEVKALVSEMQAAGWYNLVWDGRDKIGQLVSSGVYLFTLKAGGYFVQTRKALLLR